MFSQQPTLKTRCFVNILKFLRLFGRDPEFFWYFWFQLSFYWCKRLVKNLSFSKGVFLQWLYNKSSDWGYKYVYYWKPILKIVSNLWRKTMTSKNAINVVLHYTSSDSADYKWYAECKYNQQRLARVGATWKPQNICMGALVALKLFESIEKYINTPSFRQHPGINFWADNGKRDRKHLTYFGQWNIRSLFILPGLMYNRGWWFFTTV